MALNPTDWLQVVAIVSNSGVLLFAYKILRYINVIEFKVNMMWAVFSKRFGTRISDDEEFLGKPKEV